MDRTCATYTRSTPKTIKGDGIFIYLTQRYARVAWTLYHPVGGLLIHRVASWKKKNLPILWSFADGRMGYARSRDSDREYKARIECIARNAVLP